MPAIQKLNFKPSTLIYPIVIVLTLWIVFWIELTFNLQFNHYGIQPLTWIGLRGILLSPFIHASFVHLLSNSLPLFLLSMALLYFYEGITRPVLIYGTLLTGFLTWLIAQPETTHIGASGVVYLIVSFLFFKGIWSKNFRLIALSLVVVFVYGSLIWGVFPGEPHISWEGHLSGFISGIVFAVIYRNYRVEKTPDQEKKEPPPSPEEIEFLNHFDEEGNFIPSSQRDDDEESRDNSSEFKVIYRYSGLRNRTKEF